MGALKKLKKKLSSASSKKKFMNNDTNSKNTKTVLGDVTNEKKGGFAARLRKNASQKFKLNLAVNWQRKL